MELIDLISVVTVGNGLLFAGIGFLIFRRSGWNWLLLPKLMSVLLALFTLVSLMTGSALSRPVTELPKYTAENVVWAAVAAAVGYVSGHLFVRRMR